MGARRRVAAGVGALAALAPIGCELTDVQIAEAEDVLLIEAYVSWTPPAPRAAANVFVHGTLTKEGELRSASPDVTIEMIAVDGERRTLLEVSPGVCVLSFSEETNPGRCYAGALPASVVPGSRVRMELVTSDGREVTGGTTLPGDFTIVSPTEHRQTCRVPERRLLEVAWTPSRGAWAYPSETSLRGVRGVLTLKDTKFQLLDDPLILFGLAISDSDTTVSFPNEYGLFDRFSDDVTTRALIELQEGLLPGISATIAVAAADRNYVNWLRGGNFNPSGLVRVPSLRGDGTGVLASTVRRSVDVEVGAPGPVRPACVGLLPAGS